MDLYIPLFIFLILQAAIRLEAVARGRRDRERVKKLREARAAEELVTDDDDGTMTEEEAALKIEAVARGNRDRERVAKMKEERERMEQEEQQKIEDEREERLRQQEEEEEAQEAEERRIQDEIEAKQAAEEAKAFADAEAAAQAKKKQTKKKKEKKRKGYVESVNRVHPDDVEICEAREIGSSKLLRNLHIGNRKVCVLLQFFE